MKLQRLMLVFLLSVNMTCLAKEVVVEIFKKEFIPTQITINVNDTVIWKNIEKRQYHNVWFKQLTEVEPNYLFPGETFQVTFSEPGIYSYLCGPHPKMTGVVTVIAP